MTTEIEAGTLSNAEAYAWLDDQWDALTGGEPLDLPEGWDPCLILDELNKDMPEPLPVTAAQWESYIELRGKLNHGD